MDRTQARQAIVNAQAQAAADSLIAIHRDVRNGRTTPERGREIAEISTRHLSAEAKAAATAEVNRRISN